MSTNDSDGTGRDVAGSAVPTVVHEWLREFEGALNTQDLECLRDLFWSDGSWRDILAITGSIRTADGADAIADLAEEAAQSPRPRQIHISEDIQALATVRYGMELTEVTFDFTTEVGEGKGIVRLLVKEDPDLLKALVLMTALLSLERSTGRPAFLGPMDGSDGGNWAEKRRYESEYGDRDPAVLIVGAGQAGLSAAAWLKALGVDTLVVEKWPRVGDNWRSRYKSLKLHNDTASNHLPFVPFPDFFPRYIPKDKLGNWFEFYVDALELNVWTSTTFKFAGYDGGTQRWTVSVDRSGVDRMTCPRHIVVATGVSGIPNVPRIGGLENFAGTVIHTTQYTDGSPFRNDRVLVVGSGTSGHDVAQDLFLHGAEVTMMQRSKTVVTSCKPGGRKYQELYLSGRPIEECDLISLSATFPMQKRWLPVLNQEIAALDKDLLDGLNAAGFETHYGDDGMGLAYEYRRRGGGYYIDIGCSQLIIDGKVKIIHARDVECFAEKGVVLNGGSVLQFDAVVLATGYKSMQEGVRSLFGSEMAERVGKVWGLNEEGELNNIGRRTAQEGLWFLAGGFPEARQYSRHLALQIQAAEVGVVL